MDEDREAATGAISHLMTDAEVPAWVTYDAASEQHQQVSLWQSLPHGSVVKRVVISVSMTWRACVL